ncbi:MAG TPA: ribosome small subunit-dependent GTPase A [Saprospiraceae bacterium]|nr:ribosome small subunit-dependent GTPase A [Saprospiraceae bacterium]
MLSGLILKSTGSWYDVLLENGDTVQARIVGKLRLDDLKSTNPLAVGDRVSINNQGEDFSINAVEKRKNYVVRQSPRKKHNVHLLASNVDQALLIVTIVEPKVKMGFIDRFLLMTEPYNIPVIIVFNKFDIYSEDDKVLLNYCNEVYTNIGYEVLPTSIVSQLNIETLRTMLKNKTTLIAGQSGVGKSSLVNQVAPGLELRTTELSDYSGKGQHTTTFAEMHLLPFGGYIIDTPGIKTLAFNNLEVTDVAHNFREFFILSSECKFSNCLHRNEPGCAVKKALEKGEISQDRYMNYLQIINEIENQNYWEVHNDI